jgi:transketolase
MLLNKDLRRRLLKAGYENKSGHFGSALSCLDAIKYLYDEILKEEDVFILSKGHGEMALFSVLESKGYNPKWTVHLNLDDKAGIHATTGSLGHGLPIGLGRAFAKKLKGEKGNIYVLTGDGEMEEGSNWEALNIANKLKIDNLTLLIDWNKYQATADVQSVGGFNNKDLENRLKSFGCTYVNTINGHSYEGLDYLKNLSPGLNGIILDTIKGKGIKCLEESHDHGHSWTEQEYIQSMESLQ